MAGERSSWALNEKKRQAQNVENEAATKQGRKSKSVRINGRAPFGYKWNEGELVHNEAEQLAIQSISKLRKMGLTYAELSEELTKRGHLTSKGTPFQPTAIRRILLRASEESA